MTSRVMVMELWTGQLYKVFMILLCWVAKKIMYGSMEECIIEFFCINNLFGYTYQKNGQSP